MTLEINRSENVVLAMEGELARRLQRSPLDQRFEDGIGRFADRVDRFCSREVHLGGMIDAVRGHLARRRCRYQPRKAG